MNIDRKIYECLAGGISDKTWDSYKMVQKEDYIKAHPFSKRAERRFPNPVIRNNVNCFKQEFKDALYFDMMNFSEQYVDDWYEREIALEEEYSWEKRHYSIKSFDGYDDFLFDYIDSSNFFDIIGDVCKSHNLPSEFSSNYVINAILDRQDLYQETTYEDCEEALKILLGKDLNILYDDMNSRANDIEDEIYHMK